MFVPKLNRGLLFYGNPGCGKTSFTNALAGHFGLNVYMFSLSSTTLQDSSLELLFEQLPSRCIVLLEDIDSAGLKRENMRDKPSKRRTPQTVYDAHSGREILIDPADIDLTMADRGGVTLSGLLNVLDGIHSKEGMITIMTSNSPDNLDPALVRPGRIDRKVLFGYCSKEVLTKLFSHIFEKAPEEIAEGEVVSEVEHDIAALAEEFAAKIPDDKLTPAEVQGYLLVHREDPVAAVAEVEEWAKSTIERKAAGTNVDTFSSEMKEEEDESDEDKSDSSYESEYDRSRRRARTKIMSEKERQKASRGERSKARTEDRTRKNRSKKSNGKGESRNKKNPFGQDISVRRDSALDITELGLGPPPPPPMPIPFDVGSNSFGAPGMNQSPGTGHMNNAVQFPAVPTCTSCSGTGTAQYVTSGPVIATHGPPLPPQQPFPSNPMTSNNNFNMPPVMPAPQVMHPTMSGPLPQLMNGPLPVTSSGPFVGGHVFAASTPVMPTQYLPTPPISRSSSDGGLQRQGKRAASARKPTVSKKDKWQSRKRDKRDYSDRSGGTSHMGAWT